VTGSHALQAQQNTRHDRQWGMADFHTVIDN